MKCEDEDDNSFPSNTSIPSPSIDEVAVLEEQQLSSASHSLQVFCRPLQHSWLFLNRAWSQKHIQLMNIRQRLSPIMFSSDVHLTTGAFWLRWSAADAEERAEGNSKPLVLKACYLWLFKSALDGAEREQKVMWWPLVCCHSAVSSGFCTPSSREQWQNKSTLQFQMLEKHVVSSSVLRLSLLDHLHFPLSTVNHLDGHKYQQPCWYVSFRVQRPFC